MKYMLGNRLLALSRRPKQAILLGVDIAIIEFSLWAAFSLRLETFGIPFKPLVALAVLGPALALPIFVQFGLYRAIVRYVGLHALVTIAKAVVLYALALAASVHFLAIADVPRSVVMIHGLLALLLIGASRALGRHWLATTLSRQYSIEQRKRVLIYGAGSAGVQLASALAHSRELSAVAMLDDDPALQQKQIGTLKVYAPDKLPELIATLHIEEVLLAIPSASRKRRNEIISQLEPLPVVVRTLPGVSEMAEGKFAIGDLREVGIEDLLGRDPVAPDPHLLRANIAGKSVMVTGAGGSIGAELCRQILLQSPAHIVLYELNEFALYSIEQELITLKRQNPEVVTRIWPLLGSVCDQNRLDRVITRFGVQTLFHAAAYKHVPLVEQNPVEGTVNNIIGTWRAAQAALAGGIETFVLVSTDKAVRPTNVMGATKRLAEMILQAMAQAYPNRTRFTMVRFGNVLGSSGSVIPVFRQQIKCGGPVTVTDPRIIRFFMTIPEAAQLVIQAGAMGQDGDVFVLDMGEPIKILDLAVRMVHLSGLRVKDDQNPDGDLEIVFTGLRPGEKLYEELLIGENASPTHHPRIQKANEPHLPWIELEGTLEQLRLACESNNSEQIRAVLQATVREFIPQCDNRDLLRVQQGARGLV